MAATKKASKKSAPKKAAKPSDVDRVRASAAAPEASRAGVVNVFDTGGLDDVSVKTIDGARAEIEVKKQTLNQAQLHELIKTLNRAAQETY